MHIPVFRLSRTDRRGLHIVTAAEHRRAFQQTRFRCRLRGQPADQAAAELIGELYETISTLNRDRGWNLTMVAPARFGEIVIDREAGCLRAKCAWKAKDPSQLGPEPAGYVRGE